MTSYNWNKLEKAIQDRYKSADTATQAELMPAVYRSRNWKATKDEPYKYPCASCGEITSTMAFFPPICNHISLDPLTLCWDCYLEFKEDVSRNSVTRQIEEDRKLQARIQSSMRSKRPQTPAGWEITATEDVGEINEMIKSIQIDIPRMIGLSDKDCHAKLFRISQIKKHLVEIQDLAKQALILRGMTRPADAAYTPEESISE